jgi:hypothetical protein
MAESKFWAYVDSINPPHYSTEDSLIRWVDGFEDGTDEWARARDFLLDEFPQGRVWDSWERSESDRSRNLMPQLLFALAWGACIDQSPAPRRFHPGDITIHSSREAFRDILFQNQPRGAVMFLWGISGEDFFSRPANAGESVSSFVRRKLRNSHMGEEQQNELRGLVLGFARNDKLKIYPFPRDWWAIVEEARREKKKMSPEDKARKQLNHELRSLIEVVGWNDVDEALWKLRP